MLDWFGLERKKKYIFSNWLLIKFDNSKIQWWNCSYTTNSLLANHSQEMDGTKTVVELTKLQKFTNKPSVTTVQQQTIITCVWSIFVSSKTRWIQKKFYVPKEQFSTHSTREHTPSHVSWCAPIWLVRTSRRDGRRWVDWSFATYMIMFTNYAFKLFLSFKWCKQKVQGPDSEHILFHYWYQLWFRTFKKE